MDSGDLISKAVFAAQASSAKELTIQPCSLYTEDKYPSLQISRSSFIQFNYYQTHLQIKKNRRITRRNYKYMIPDLIYGPRSNQEKFH